MSSVITSPAHSRFSRIRLSRRSDNTLSVWAILGLLLIPLMVGGALLAGLGDPFANAHRITAAIVNEDEPVTVNGTYTPVGRLFAAQIAAPSDSNYTWQITSAEQAAAGLADGSYTAMVTIPRDFSAAATSASGDPAQARRAQVQVVTSDRSGVIDSTISDQLTKAAANVVSDQLTNASLTGLFVGFTKVHDGISQTVDGATQLTDGAQQAASGTQDLANGISQLDSGAGRLADGTGQLATGADQLSDGLRQLRDQTAALPDQTKQLADGVEQYVTPISQVAKQVSSLADQATTQRDALTQQITTQLDSIANALTTAQQQACASDPASAACTQAGAALQQLEAQRTVLGQRVDDAFAQVQQVGQYATQLDVGGERLVAGSRQLADGMAPLAVGIGQLSDGASTLASGAHTLQTGATQLASGTRDASSGATKLAEGNAQLTTGAGALRDGLTEAVGQIPSYTDDEQRSLADAITRPVTSDADPALAFGNRTLAPAIVLALWIGAIAVSALMRALPDGILLSSRSTWLLAVRNLPLPLLLLAAEGVLVAVIATFGAGLSGGTSAAVGGLAVLSALAFAVINHGLTALFGAVGRVIAVAMGAITLAGALFSGVSNWLVQIDALLPTHAALRMLQSVIGPAAGDTASGGAISAATIGADIVSLVTWAAIGVVFALIAVWRRRTISIRQLTASGARV